MINNVFEYVQSCVEKYKEFVGISDFPVFNIKSKEITISKSQSQGFDSFASAFYDVETGQHTLEIWSQLYKPQMHADYLIYHEFTHLWDAEVYSQRDKIKHVSNKGYTEYHAAQIDFLKVLGAKHVKHPFLFDMNQPLDTIGNEKTAYAFVDMPRQLASDLILRSDFPENIETLATTLGAIFNFYGRRSICKMYAKDYDDSFDMTAIIRFLGPDTIGALDLFLVNWLNTSQISLLDTLYYRMAVSLAQRNNLV